MSVSTTVRQVQLERACASVLTAVASGYNTVDKVIQKRNARMSTLVAIKHLKGVGALLQNGNLLYIAHQVK